MKKELKFIPIYKGEFNKTEYIEYPTFSHEEEVEEFRLPLHSNIFELATLFITVSYLLYAILR